MMNVIQKGTKKLKDTRGATMIEYALIVTIVSIVAITALTGIGNGLNTKFTDVSTKLG